MACVKNVVQINLGVVLDKIKIYGKDIEDIELIILCILSSFFCLYMMVKIIPHLPVSLKYYI